MCQGVRKKLRGVFRTSRLVYNRFMAKRDTGVGKMKKSHSYKTKKRLEIKRKMLALKASKKHQ
jgi:hypothetical protein